MSRRNKKSTIFFKKSHITSKKLIASLCSLEGKKIVAVDACEAGGFVQSAEKKGDPDIAVFTSSDKKETNVNNPFLNIMLRMARSKTDEPFASEFFRLNGKIGKSRKRFTNYSPQSYVGKNIAHVRL
jgi:hypothetical protein